MSLRQQVPRFRGLFIFNRQRIKRISVPIPNSLDIFARPLTICMFTGQNSMLRHIPLEPIVISPLRYEFDHGDTKKNHRRRLSKVPLVLVLYLALELALVCLPQGNRHVKVQGEVKRGEDQNETSPADADEHAGEDDDYKPAAGDRDIDLVGARVGGMWAGHEAREVAAAGFGVGGPFVEADAEEDEKG